MLRDKICLYGFMYLKASFMLKKSQIVYFFTSILFSFTAGFTILKKLSSFKNLDFMYNKFRFLNDCTVVVNSKEPEQIRI